MRGWRICDGRLWQVLRIRPGRQSSFVLRHSLVLPSLDIRHSPGLPLKLVPFARPVLGLDEDFGAVFGHEECVFELG